VGMTRACYNLFISVSDFYGEGKRARKLSPFVTEALGEERLQYSVSSSQKSKQLSFFDFQPAPAENTTMLNTGYQIPNTKKRIPITYLSYSQIETFRFCPLHYKAKYILRIPTPAYAAQTFGKTMHDTLKIFYQGLRSGEEWNEQDLLSLYEKTWVRAGFESRAQEQLMKEMGNRNLHDFMKYLHAVEPLPKEIEKPFIFSASPRLKIGGVIDRINVLSDGRIEIIDYKTSAKIPTQKDIDKNLQLTVYALAVMNVPGLAPVHDPKDIVLSLYFFNQHQKISTSRTAAQLDAAKKELVDIAEEMATSDFICSGTEWCRTCEYKMLCGAYVAF
jgi:DNA helicase II / ATP-dependent DNA helicase PcrA